MPRDVLIFLIQLSVALNKTRAYPPGHPVLSAALDVLIQQLSHLLRDRPALTLGIAPEQLIVEGAASDPAHPVLRDLASRLHNHQLAGLRILRGVPSEEVQDLLQAVAEESWRQSNPLGLQVASAGGRPRLEPRAAGAAPARPADHGRPGRDLAGRRGSRGADLGWARGRGSREGGSRGRGPSVRGDGRRDDPPQSGRAGLSWTGCSRRTPARAKAPAA